MSLGYWLLRPWRHAFDFSGRSPRREYWLFVLQTYVAIIALVMLAVATNSGRDDVEDGVAATFLILAGLFALGSFIPGLAVAVRRLHDQNRPGILLLLGLVPGIGGFIVLFFMLIDGDEQENDYGPNPLDTQAMPGVSEVFE